MNSYGTSCLGSRSAGGQLSQRKVENSCNERRRPICPRQGQEGTATPPAQPRSDINSVASAVSSQMLDAALAWCFLWMRCDIGAHPFCACSSGLCLEHARQLRAGMQHSGIGSHTGQLPSPEMHQCSHSSTQRCSGMPGQMKSHVILPHIRTKASAIVYAYVPSTYVIIIDVSIHFRQTSVKRRIQRGAHPSAPLC